MSPMTSRVAQRGVQAKEGPHSGALGKWGAGRPGKPLPHFSPPAPIPPPLSLKFHHRRLLRFKPPVSVKPEAKNSFRVCRRLEKIGRRPVHGPWACVHPKRKCPLETCAGTQPCWPVLGRAAGAGAGGARAHGLRSGSPHVAAPWPWTGSTCRPLLKRSQLGTQPSGRRKSYRVQRQGRTWGCGAK